MSELRTIDHIVVHCSDSPNSGNFKVSDVDQWHQERGFHRDHEWVKRFNPSLLAIGYHFFIDRTGANFSGRHINEIGAHVEGHNSHSIGICLCGKDIFTESQIVTLRRQIISLLQVYPAAQVCGHYEFDTAIKQGKTCPNFDVRKWWASVDKTDPQPIHEPIVSSKPVPDWFSSVFSRLIDIFARKS